jgi:hypothetical protein
VSLCHRQLAPADEGVAKAAGRPSSARAGGVLTRITVAVIIAAATLAIGCDFNDGSLSDADRQLIRENILPKVPSMDLPVNADFDGKLLYLGCDIDKTQVSPGEAFTVVHYWEVRDPPGPDWKLFTHLGPRTINVDRTPIKGKYPVAEWKAGEIIRDEQTVTVPVRWTAPFIIVYVGIFHGTTRLEVRSGEQDGDNRVIAVRMPVRGTPRDVAVPALDVRKAWRRPVVDGKLDDPAWAEIPSAKQMVNSETGGSVVPATDVKLLWDAKYLFVGLRAADVARTAGDGITVILAQEGARSAIEVDVSGLGQVQVWQPSVGTDAPGTNEAPAKSSAARRGKGRNRPGRKFRVGGHSGLQVEAALADVEIRPVNSTLPTSPIATKSGATTTAGSAHAGVTVAAGINAQWTAEVAVPWSAFPGSGAGSVEGVSQLRGNFSRHNQSAEGIATRSAWSPTLGAPLADMAHLGVLNLLDDVGTQLVSRTPPLTPGQRDLPGEMRTLTLDR